ncbi:MAG: hypothetical protein ACNA7V_09755 [Bacteroidales bacterium]
MKNDYLIKNMLKSAMILFFAAFLVAGVAFNASAQKFQVTGNDAQLNQSTEIGLSGTTVGKFYYLFRIDEAGKYHSVTFQFGQGVPIVFAPQKASGKYVIYEFSEFKELPFNFELYKPEDGILQTGSVTISSKKK